MQFFSRHSAYRLVAATGCLCLVASTAWAQAHFKPDVVRKYGGTYASDCSNPDAPRLRVLRDALVVEQGDKRVVGRKVQAAFTYFGPSAPPSFKMALVSEVHSGSALDFMVFEDKNGTSIHLQADASLQAALGKTLLSPRYHRCDDALSPNAGTITQNEPMSDAEKMLLDPAFKATYLRVLGPLAREAWLAKFNGPRPPARRVRVAGMDYLLLAVCKPHSCADFNAALLYAEDRDRLFGKVYQQGRIGYLGEPSPDIADALDTLWANQWQQK
ncbi:Ivy family c-type lysozyme inhibitor [Rhodoferax sp.]|uniref:Ivy family c-type lysozyme inhibitor n=1 Tax=Rhodoferax sp. TaxID=50421 RepID=UPI0025F2EE46|nr:Ivy family c-type lysozyme inhibitor [Rhodoferax sp.]